MLRKEEVIGRRIREIPLPAGFIKKGFIKQNGQKGDYSPDDYLREFLNSSSWFMRKTNGELFVKPKSEAHGECDAITKCYRIDFKQILGESMQYAIANTAEQIDEYNGTATLYRKSIREGEFKAVRLHIVLRDYSTNDLECIYSSNGEGFSDIETDIAQLLKSIDKEKHLLLFYPVLLKYEGDDDCTKDDVAKVFASDYMGVATFRKVRHPDKETYFAFIFECSFVIVVVEDNDFKVVDEVDVKFSNTFNWILDKHFAHPIYKEFEKSIP